MIEPKVEVIDGKEFILSKFPAVAGREIIAKYPMSAIPILGDYEVNQETMLKLMGFVAVRINDQELRLSTQSLVDNHVPSWETLAKIEMAMMEYNCSFFQSGRISTFLTDLEQMLPVWVSKMLTALSQQLSQMEKPPLKNSKKRTV